MNRLTQVVLAATAMAGMSALADEHTHPAPSAVSNPAWDKVKTLVGSWEGVATEEGKQMPATTSFRLVSAGSAVMNVLGEGTPHEMVTMFHLDLKDLLATHYCAAQNQPRLKAGALTAKNQLTFEFKDGTNIGPGDGHMQRLLITFVDADHHNQDWTFVDKGKESTGHFEFHRSR